MQCHIPPCFIFYEDILHFAVQFQIGRILWKQSISKFPARLSLLDRPRALPLAVNNLPNEETLAGMWKEKQRGRWIGWSLERSDLPYNQAIR